MSAEGFFGPSEQNLADMIQMWGLAKVRGILTIKSGTEEGEVHFDGGKVVWAKIGPYLVNEDAIYHMLALESGKFRFVNTININDGGSWCVSYQEIIMEGMRRLDHLNNEKKAIEDKLGLIPFLSGNISDRNSSEEEKVFFGLVDGRRNLQKVFSNCGLGLHKSLEIFNRLRSEGCLALRKVKVLVVDDQAVWRKVISRMLAKEKFFEIVGSAEDGIEALRKLSELKPDVMTLDLEMPRLDGIKTLYWIMSGGYDILLKSQYGIEIEDTYRCPVVVISAVATKMAAETLEALMGGATGYITKPSQVVTESLEKQQQRIAKTVLTASQVDLIKSRRIKKKDVVNKEDKDDAPEEDARKLVCIGASMVGGLTSLMRMIPNFPKDIDAALFVVIDDLTSIDHVRSFADFLDRHSNIKVMAAERNTIAKRGVLYISPGSQAVKFGITNSGQAAFKVSDYRDAGNGSDVVFRPIDNMLTSAIKCKGFDKRIGVVLAGDGTDGKVGYLEMVKNGEKVLAQDAYSSLSPIKPENIASTGIAKIISLDEMVKNILDEVGRAVP